MRNLAGSALLLLLPCLLTAEEPASTTLAGELVHVNLQRAQVTLKVPDAADPSRFREHEIDVTPETRITSRGRTQKLDEARAGDPAVAVCTTDARGSLRAVTLKLGPSSYAAPPAPPRSPRPPS
jgi:hypothetical protein